MALLLPILFLIVFGIINFGIIYYDYSLIESAAHQGANWASVNTTLSNTSSYVCNTNVLTNPCGVAFDYVNSKLITFAGIGTTPLSINYSAPSSYTAGDLQTVSISYNFTGVGYNIYYKYLGPSGVLHLKSTAKMYHE
jgi:hypothetical protein